MLQGPGFSGIVFNVALPINVDFLPNAANAFLGAKQSVFLFE